MKSVFTKHKKIRLYLIRVFCLAIIIAPVAAYAITPCGSGQPSPKGNAYMPSIDLGCRNKGNPILDVAFGIIHFLSYGVGIVVVASFIVAGIQFTASRGNPQATEKAINRIRSNVLALLLFIFAYAILNYVVPGQVLK